MRRCVPALLAGVLVLCLAGCGAALKTSNTGTPSGTSSAEPVKVTPYAAIPKDGVHEKAAYDAVPAALAYVQKTTREQKRTVTDVSAGTPTLVSYTLEARVGDRVSLFEVRGDGKAYELYRYPASPDPAKLFWQNVSGASGARLVEPLGAGESAAAAAVAKVMEQAVPGQKATIQIQGYNFYWIKKDGTPVNTPGGSPFTMMIDPSGAAGSWSS